MKNWKTIIGGALLVGLANPTFALLLDFEDSSDLGVSLGGAMTWNGAGGGHLYNESYLNDDFIYFSEETYVNSFEMNALPWLNYPVNNGTIGKIDIAGLDSSNQTVWSTTVDLTNYTDWSNWFTVEVETADILTLAFTAPGSAPHRNGFWPSVDNLVINEGVDVPEPSSIMLLGLGLAGLGFVRKRKIL